MIKLRTNSPLNGETVIESVRKTGRAVVVHEAPRTGGLSAEFVARINDDALPLDGWRMDIGYPRIERKPRDVYRGGRAYRNPLRWGPSSASPGQRGRRYPRIGTDN